MTKDEALKLALEALEEPHPGVRTSFSDAMTYREKIKTAITAIKEALTQPEQTFSPDWDAMAVMVEEQQRMAKRIKELEQRYEFKIYGKAWSTDGENVYVDGVRQEPSEQEPMAMLFGSLPVYDTAPPQPEERNFCPRCGKRTKDIHTCTPPKPINWVDHEPT